jgi:hypothetical protein
MTLASVATSNGTGKSDEDLEAGPVSRENRALGIIVGNSVMGCRTVSV